LLEQTPPWENALERKGWGKRGRTFTGPAGRRKRSPQKKIEKKGGKVCRGGA